MEIRYSHSLVRSRWMVLLTGSLFTLFGLISLINTWLVLEVAAIYIGVVSLVAGLVSIFYAISNYTFVGWAWAMVEGVVDVLFGILILTYPASSAKALPLMIGLWIVFRGLLFMVDSFSSHKRYRVRSAFSRFAVGIALMIIGFVLIIGWDMSVPIISVLVSMSFVFMGLWNLVIGLEMYTQPRRLP